MPRFRSIAWALPWAALLLAVAHARIAVAATADVLAVRSVSVGFGGQFKAGFWQPVHLALVAGPQAVSGSLELVVKDSDQTPVVYAGQAESLQLEAGEERTVLLYAKSGPVNASWRVQLRAGSGVTWSHDLSSRINRALDSTQELVVGVGPRFGLEEAVATLRRRPENALRAVTVDKRETLPDRWWCYSGIDALVLTTSDAAFLGALPAAQRNAIVQWVELGGRLVLAVGGRGEEVLAADSPWRTLVPGKLDEVVALRESSGLENFTKSELPRTEAFQRQRPRLTKLKEVRGQVLLDETSGGTTSPLIVRAGVGLGQVTFVGLDLDHPSLQEWKGRERLIASLLNREASEREASGEERQARITQLGYTDLIGQLRTALDQFPGVTLVNFTTVAVLTGAYLLLVGPGDYLLLSRLNWPRQATWITFPLVALALIGVAFGLGGQAHGNRVRLNQAEIVDIDLERQVARGTVWAHLYSPKTAHYDLQLSLAAPREAFPSPQGWLAWQGLPGDALGGLESRQVMLASAEPYRVALPGPAPAIEGLAVQVAASKSLGACWWAETRLDAQAALALDSFGHLEGKFRNPLHAELLECMVVHGDKLYRLGTLAPGQAATIDPQQSLNLEWRLTQRRLENSKDVSTPWEQDSTDVPRIVPMLMFHEAARGRSYTGLTHRYQPQLDFSEQAKLGQAILVGRAKTPVASLTTDSSPVAAAADTITWTWYRVVLPIARPSAN